MTFLLALNWAHFPLGWVAARGRRVELPTVGPFSEELLSTAVFLTPDQQRCLISLTIPPMDDFSLN